jgi:hypothetical protein
LIFVIILANLIKRFSRVPQQLLAWSERKLTAVKLCHGRIKAWEILFNRYLPGFLF